jgi:hypothetical protein
LSLFWYFYLSSLVLNFIECFTLLHLTSTSLITALVFTLLSFLSCFISLNFFHCFTFASLVLSLICHSSVASLHLNFVHGLPYFTCPKIILISPIASFVLAFLNCFYFTYLFLPCFTCMEPLLLFLACLICPQLLSLFLFCFTCLEALCTLSVALLVLSFLHCFTLLHSSLFPCLTLSYICHFYLASLVLRLFVLCPLLCLS